MARKVPRRRGAPVGKSSTEKNLCQSNKSKVTRPCMKITKRNEIVNIFFAEPTYSLSERYLRLEESIPNRYSDDKIVAKERSALYFPYSSGPR